MQASGDQRKALREQLEKRLASMRSAFAARWIRRAAPRAEPRVKPKVLYGLLVLRGFERLGDRDDAAAVVQECSCSIDLLREMQRSTISQENRSGCGRSSSSSLFQRRVARARGEATMGKRSFDQAVLERLCDLDCATALALLCCHCKPDAALPLKN
jgi:hypothetical protein